MKERLKWGKIRSGGTMPLTEIFNTEIDHEN